MNAINLQRAERTLRLAADTGHRRGGRFGEAVDGVAVTSARMIAGRYRLITQLGTGGMGSVWLAEDTVLRRAVALKRFTDRDREDRPSALQEARAAARLTYPGVVRVYDLALEDDEDWIVMEALSGEPLSAVLRERGRLPLDEVTRIGVQLLSALQAIHDADLVHRDIKPSNVQVCGDGRIVITDFGLSSRRGAWGGLRVGAVAGSLSFMAPETLMDGVFGPSSDLYALGVTLYIALEGRPPFDPGGRWSWWTQSFPLGRSRPGTPVPCNRCLSASWRRTLSCGWTLPGPVPACRRQGS